MRILKKYVDFMDKTTDWIGNIPVYIVLITVFMGFLNVVLRYTGQIVGLKLTNNILIELQWYLYALIFLLGFPYILRHQVNVRVDFWYAEQSPKLKAKIDAIGNFIALIPFTLLAIYVTWSPILTSWGKRPNGEWCFQGDGGSAVTYFLDMFNVMGRYCGEISPDPNGLNRAPIKTMVLLVFILLLLQTIAEMIRLFATMCGQGDIFASDEPDTDAPIRIE